MDCVETVSENHLCAAAIAQIVDHLLLCFGFMNRIGLLADENNGVPCEGVS